MQQDEAKLLESLPGGTSLHLVPVVSFITRAVRLSCGRLKMSSWGKWCRETHLADLFTSYHNYYAFNLGVGER
jgi:hypothetical protein